ncbi:MAG TPA: BamA/TamA family outer membrane protein [Vicinamibacterales bacterium]
MKGVFSRPALLATLFFVILATPSVSRAQGGYFGRNKVQYQKFDFKVLKTDHFDIYYYTEEEEAAKMASRMAERWYTRLSQLLNHELSTRQPLILYASGAHFRQTNAIEGDLGEGTGGVTEAYKRRIVLPFAGPIEASDHVLGHELVHAFQYDITGTNVSSGAAGALALPLWFIEGMAEYLSLGPVDPHTAMWMREAARREKLPTVDQLDNPKYFPYRYGQALWAYIAGKYGDGAVGNMLRAAAGRDSSYDVAIKSVLQIDPKELSKEWHAAEFESFRPIAEATKMPATFARGLILKGKTGGELNLGPELSPDGSKLIYFSEKDLFSIDLYLADAKTGQVIRKITDTATSAHYESLSFLTSAGAWDPSGKRFVFPGLAKGTPILTIVDVDSGRTEREIQLAEVHEVVNPTWSPDGKQIAFSALVGGFNDLFSYDLEKSAIKRLTTDSFAEIDPAWSPDGQKIVFSTDRFTTNLQTIKPGHLKLAMLDVASGAVTQVGGFDNAKNIGPQWTPDGKSLFFLSDRGGITNIYRMDASGGNVMQLTNMLTGASGITSMSPAMSAAGGRVVFGAYEEDNYNIYALDTADQLTGEPPIGLPRNAAVLPPRREPGGLVVEALSDPTWGLPGTEVAVPEAYKPKWGLDYAGQPSIGVGVDPFGTYATGGIALMFSDMLGNHVIGTAAQVTSRFDEFGGTLFYVNRTHRWNWGLAVDQTPYVSRGFDALLIGNTYIENEYRFLQRDQSGSGFISYPLNRSLRVEFGGGYRRIGQKFDVTERTFSAITGQLLSQERRDLETFDTLNLGEASTALVFDTSISGATSPIRGSRSRLEFGQIAGGLNYSSVLADARTYLMPLRPYTIALRGMYYGRLGDGASDERLPALFIGYPGLVRGYDYNSFESSECVGSVAGSCPVFDRLIGSRVAVGNAELRFPIWGAFSRNQFYGPLPVEAAIFTDAGVTWGRSDRSGFAPTDSQPVVSVGAALRVNVLGFAVAEIDYVKPLDRPQRGWLWQFSLRPGF